MKSMRSLTLAALLSAALAAPAVAGPPWISIELPANRHSAPRELRAVNRKAVSGDRGLTLAQLVPRTCLTSQSRNVPSTEPVSRRLPSAEKSTDST